MTEHTPRALSRRAFVGLAPLAVAPLAAHCDRSRRGDALVVGVSALRISLPVFLAFERGLFARHGLRVERRVYPTAQPLVDDVVLGNIDLGGFAAWPIVLLSSARAASPVRVTAAIIEDAEHRVSYVLARRGSGLRFPIDGRVRSIGVLPTVAYRRWLTALLERTGVNPASVTVVPIEPALQAEALARGAVDLLFTNDPMATAMLARGVAEVADDGPPCARRLGSPFSFGTFLCSGALATRNPGQALAAQRALDEAIVATREDPAAARRAMAPHVRPEERPFIDRYPDARYLTSAQLSSDDIASEIAREHALGIATIAPRVARLEGPRAR